MSYQPSCEYQVGGGFQIADYRRIELIDGVVGLPLSLDAGGVVLNTLSGRHEQAVDKKNRKEGIVSASFIKQKLEKRQIRPVVANFGHHDPITCPTRHVHFGGWSPPPIQCFVFGFTCGAQRYVL